MSKTLLLRLPVTFLRLLNPIPYIMSIGETLCLLRRYRFLLQDMSIRDVKDQYLGKGLGILWAIIQPVFLICVYLFAFVYVFKIKMEASGGAIKPVDDLTLYIISGIIPFMACQSALAKSTMVLQQNTNLVKQMVFPIEVLPVKILSSILLTQVMCTILLFGYMLYVYHTLPITVLLWPVLVFIQYAFLAGCSYILSVLSPFFKDISEIVTMLCTVLLYASPIFYNIQMLPDVLQPWMMLNPFAHLLICYRDLFYNGALLHPISWVVISALALLALGIGTRLFSKLKILLGNVL